MTSSARHDDASRNTARVSTTWRDRCRAREKPNGEKNDVVVSPKTNSRRPRVVASVDKVIVDLMVYRHNSLNSEGGACFQVTISRHLRRTRSGAGRAESKIEKAERTSRRERAELKTNLGDERVPVYGNARVFGLLRSDALDHKFRAGQDVQRHAGFLWSAAMRREKKRRGAKRATERMVSRRRFAPPSVIGFFASRRSTANRSTVQGRIGVHSVPQPRFSVDYTPVVRHSDEE